ncbi:hypothetical protein B4U80_12637, partial [Leptotrombidium deliense]
NDQEVQMVIDTQSDVSLIREDVIERIGPLSRPEAEVRISGITNNSITTNGVGEYDLTLDGVALKGVEFVVIPKQYMTSEILLGKNVLEDSKITMVLQGNKATFINEESASSLHVQAVETKKQTAKLPPEKPKAMMVNKATQHDDEIRPAARNEEEKTEVSEMLKGQQKDPVKSINSGVVNEQAYV